jgi:hypothetical protein
MTNAERILLALDAKLTNRVELTLYGRAALVLGFVPAPHDYALSRDVDAVLWLGQAESLNEQTNFWSAVDAVNEELAEDDLYVSHFFAEDQVILLPSWRANRVKLPGDWQRLDLYRLGDVDLLLSKLMRDDPVDQGDAEFIVARSGLSRQTIERALREARVPDSREVEEQFRLASTRLLARL